MAVNLAKKHNTKLHILHITSSEEIELFDNILSLKEKRINQRFVSIFYILMQKIIEL